MTAYAWANLSAAQGNTKAVSLRDDLEHLLTPSELSQAQELSRKWQASNPASARRELEEITRFAEDAIAAKRDSTHSPATTTQRAVAP